MLHPSRLLSCNITRLTKRVLGIALGILISNQVNAVLPMKVKIFGNFVIQYAAGSSDIPDSYSERLVKHARCIAASPNTVVSVITDGDRIPIVADGISQLALAAERANVVRRRFIALGVADKFIYTEAHAMVPENHHSIKPPLEGGIAKIEYVGACYGLQEQLDTCSTLCEGLQ